LCNHAAQWERYEDSGDIGLMNAGFKFDGQHRNDRMQCDAHSARVCISRRRCVRRVRCGLPCAGFRFRNISVLCRCKWRRVSAAVSFAIRLAGPKQVFEKLKHVQSLNRSSALSGSLS
jgi:hypothetical protein